MDNLKAPLGIDDPAPRFSWQLLDPSNGAKQTAYELQIATKPELLSSGKPDVWDSGRIESERIAERSLHRPCTGGQHALLLAR